jgi:TPP-dependent pyruvate/acetoin dehydrogenase alpha subunit
LKPDDVICTTHRGHAHYIGKGIDLKRLCCEIWGKKEGYGKGRAGHMIIFNPENGILGGSGIVGGSIPLAVGQALAFQMKKEARVAVSFFGDGASNTGSFHESLNMAAKWRLPVVFFCENNQYGLTVHVDEHLSVRDISVRAKAYDIPGLSIFGNDMVEVYNTMHDAAERAREGEGPMLIEAKTYRMHGYSTGDTGGYQEEETILTWREKDPIRLAEGFLLDQQGLTETEIRALRERALSDVQAAMAYALSAPYPESLDVPGDLFKGARG